MLFAENLINLLKNWVKSVTIVFLCHTLGNDLIISIIMTFFNCSKQCFQTFYSLGAHTFLVASDGLLIFSFQICYSQFIVSKVHALQIRDNGHNVIFLINCLFKLKFPHMMYIINMSIWSWTSYNFVVMVRVGLDFGSVVGISSQTMHFIRLIMLHTNMKWYTNKYLPVVSIA